MVAYDYNNLVATADWLWQLATDDSRPTNQYSNHPMRVLKELASISVYKPLDYSMIMVGRVAAWLGDDKPHLYSPLEVVEPVLATEGMDHEGDALSIRLKPFAINIEAVAQIRNTVLDLAFAEIESTDLRRAGRGVETVGAALHYPHGYSGNAVPAEVSETWTAPFIQTIVRLGKVARGARLDPAIQIKVRTVLSWHEKYSPTATKAAAKRAVSLQRTTIENELAVLLLGAWHQTATSGTLLAASGESKVAGFSNYLKSHRGTTTDDDYEGTQNRLAARCRDFADLLRTTYSPASVVEMIERRLHATAASGGTSRGNSGYFVWTLVELWPEAGLETLRRVAATPGSALTEIVSVALARLAETRPTDAIRCARELLAAGDETVEALVASAFGWNRGNRVTLLPGEWDLLLDFSAHPSVSVRAAAVRAADVLTASDPARALTLLVAISFRDSSKLADDIFSCFGESSGLNWSAVAKADQETLLAELTECPSLDEHHLTQLLDHLSRSEPVRTLKLLTDRIEKAESERAGSRETWA